MSSTETKSCLTCGTIFSLRCASRRDRQKFCSRACNAKHQRLTGKLQWVSDGYSASPEVRDIRRQATKKRMAVVRESMMALSEKTCTKCRRVLPNTFEHFYKSRTGLTRAACRSCCNVKRSTETRKRISLKSKYGLSVVRFEEMQREQGHVCAICGEACQSRPRLSVDHCHKTGIVRGLLCHLCNLMLGYARDDISILRSATEYLENKNAIKHG